MERINVTQTFLPPFEEYETYLQQLWQSRYLTNQGPLLREFESQASKYLGVENFQFVTNGTTALQLALRALDITEGEIITTPFSFVATTSAILWERCKPIFVDIEPDTFCIDPNKIEAAITSNTKAIMSVHVFGYPSAVTEIEKIARKHNLKVIYDGAHAFGAMYRGQSLLSYGDVSTCSFHATKLFHTIEGGAVITPHKELSDKLDLIKKFGYVGDDQLMLGVNAKASEFNAAMGLANLKYIDGIIAKRRDLTKLYDRELTSFVTIPPRPKELEPNYIYYPVVFESEGELLKTKSRLEKQNVFPRRYFYPSLNTIAYVQPAPTCPVSERIARTILCLPLYSELSPDDALRIARIVKA